VKASAVGGTPLGGCCCPGRAFQAGKWVLCLESRRWWKNLVSPVLEVLSAKV
jgi:hypothetical protein